MRYILDTNVLLRFLVGDVPLQQKQAGQWFKEAERGEREIVVTPIVIAEAAFVLESFYHQKRSQIADSLEVVVAQPWLTVESRPELMGLWKWYHRGLHFVDSFLLAWAEGESGEILSFDRQVQGTVARNKKKPNKK